jgi:hypothetical protein
VNAKQAQIWLGHHSPSFTLSVYTHLLSDDLPDSPFEGHARDTRPAETEREAAAVVNAGTPDLRAVSS